MEIKMRLAVRENMRTQLSKHVPNTNQFTNQSIFPISWCREHQLEKWNTKVTDIRTLNNGRYHCISAPNALFLARFTSSSEMRCSIRYCAVPMAFGVPVMVTMRLRVPGAKMPFFDIWMLAPLRCWISISDLPPGPDKLYIYNPQNINRPESYANIYQLDQEIKVKSN